MNLAQLIENAWDNPKVVFFHDLNMTHISSQLFVVPISKTGVFSICRSKRDMRGELISFISSNSEQLSKRGVILSIMRYNDGVYIDACTSKRNVMDAINTAYNIGDGLVHSMELDKTFRLPSRMSIHTHEIVDKKLKRKAKKVARNIKFRIFLHRYLHIAILGPILFGLLWLAFKL